jgi:hypothetical protein
VRQGAKRKGAARGAPAAGVVDRWAQDGCKVQYGLSELIGLMLRAVSSSDISSMTEALLNEAHVPD